MIIDLNALYLVSQGTLIDDLLSTVETEILSNSFSLPLERRLSLNACSN